MLAKIRLLAFVVVIGLSAVDGRATTVVFANTCSAGGILAGSDMCLYNCSESCSIEDTWNGLCVLSEGSNCNAWPGCSRYGETYCDGYPGCAEVCECTDVCNSQ